jgi:hypothetical protein
MTLTASSPILDPLFRVLGGSRRYPVHSET